MFKKIFRLFTKANRGADVTRNVSMTETSDTFESFDIENLRFPLVPDNFHLRDVGKTRQGNGFWITSQLIPEGETTRDFIAAYIFDRDGGLISSEVVDLGCRDQSEVPKAKDVINGLKRKIDAAEKGEIWVKPFSVSFYGHTFGLIPRKIGDALDPHGEYVVDAEPGSTYMFYGPWDLCNYDT